MHLNKNTQLPHSATPAMKQNSLVNYMQPSLPQCLQEIPVQVLENIAELESALHVDGGWNENSIKQALNDDYTHIIYLLANVDTDAVEDESKTESTDKNMTVIAYCIYQAIFETAEIYRIGTNSHYQKQGHANQLMKCLFDILKDKQCESLLLEVKANNLPAINLYKKNQFKQINIRRSYYKTENESIDALIMQKILN